jgi:cytosine/adenosine deaminase-related metal-dependent hydrolase
MTRTLTARWVLPAAGPPLEGGLVTIRDGKIEAVEPHGARATDDDLGNVAIIPGLVNPHTHLDLSGARGLIPTTDPEHFTDWLKGVIAYRKTLSPEQVQVDIRTGLAECLKYGTTLIGDIASGGASWDVVTKAAVRGVVFFEMIGLTKERAKEAYDHFVEWLRHVLKRKGNCRFAQSPHAPYSAYGPVYVTASPWSCPSAIHLAETRQEEELVEHGRGPFVQFLNDLGIWPVPKESFASWHITVIGSSSLNPAHQLAQEKNYYRLPPVLFIHANYLPIDSPIGTNQTVVYCPRTHAAFGHPPHPFREFLKRGVRVCLGTDSLASNPDLDILAEARFVHAKYPDFPGEQLLKMVTLAGAEALGWADECGSLEPVKYADLVAVPLPDRDGDPYELLFSGELGDQHRRTMFRGEWRH